MEERKPDKDGRYWGNCPTEYDGKTYRSMLESRVAMLLTELKISFEYEKKAFVLPSRCYLPDFYCPKIKTWVEARGYDIEESKKTMRELANKTGEMVVMFSPKESFCIPRKEDYETWGDESDDTIGIFVCSECHNSFFTTLVGYYGCPVCGYHNGNHDGMAWVGECAINDFLYSHKTLTEWLNNIKKSYKYSKI